LTAWAASANSIVTFIDFTSSYEEGAEKRQSSAGRHQY